MHVGRVSRELSGKQSVLPVEERIARKCCGGALFISLCGKARHIAKQYV